MGGDKQARICARGVRERLELQVSDAKADGGEGGCWACEVRCVVC